MHFYHETTEKDILQSIDKTNEQTKNQMLAIFGQNAPLLKIDANKQQYNQLKFTWVENKFHFQHFTYFVITLLVYLLPILNKIFAGSNVSICF